MDFVQSNMKYKEELLPLFESLLEIEVDGLVEVGHLDLIDHLLHRLGAGYLLHQPGDDSYQYKVYLFTCSISLNDERFLMRPINSLDHLFLAP